MKQSISILSITFVVPVKFWLIDEIGYPPIESSTASTVISNVFVAEPKFVIVITSFATYPLPQLVIWTLETTSFPDVPVVVISNVAPLPDAEDDVAPDWYVPAAGSAPEVTVDGLVMFAK